MKKYIKPSIEVTEVVLESAILAASNGEVSKNFGITEIEGTSSQALEMRKFSLWDDDAAEE